MHNRYQEGFAMKYSMMLLWILLAGFLALGWVGFEEKSANEKFTPEIVAKPEIRLLDQEGAGRLYGVGSWTVCVMEGAPAEMGFQHGKLLAGHIHGMVQKRYMVRALLGRGYTMDYINEQAVRMERHFPAEYIEEMRGIVKGLRAAGVEDIGYEHLRACVVVAEIQHRAPGSPPGCTNFAVFGKWTKDGRLLHGRNLDWNIRGQAQDDAVILVWRPKNGKPFMMVGWAGCIGSVSGMNASGITIGEMTSSSPDETFDGLPLFLTMRLVLEKASTLEEAVKIIRDKPRTLGWNYVIGDGAVPDACALEVDAETCEIFGPMDTKEEVETGHAPLPDAVRRTNHPCGGAILKKIAGMYAKKMGIDLEPFEAVRPLVKSFMTSRDSWQRYSWLGEQIRAKPEGIGVKEALELLANGPVKCGATLHSWVFDPKNHAAYVANAGTNPVRTASERPYVRIDLEKWFE